MSLGPLFSSFFTYSAVNKNLEKRSVNLVRKLLEPAISFFSRFPFQANQPLVRLSETEKAEFIKEKSILHKKEDAHTTIKNSSHLLEVLGQIHGDSFGKGELFETLPSHVAAAIWVDLLKETKESIPEKLKNSLNQYRETTLDLSVLNEESGFAQNIRKLSISITEKIHELKVGETFLLEGGRRRGSIAQPMVLEFTRASDTSFDLVVYYTGNERGAFRKEVVEEGKKKWICPYMCFKNIPKEKLFFSKPSGYQEDFFYAILFYRFIDSKMKIVKNFELNVSNEFIFQKLFAHLYPYHLDGDGYISERSSSTESWSSIKAFVCKYLPKQTYKKVIFEIKLNTLIQGFQFKQNAIIEDDLEAEKLRQILRKGASGILKNLISFQNIGIELPKKMALEAESTALDLLNTLDEIEANIFAKRRKKSIAVSFSALEDSPFVIEKTFGGIEAISGKKKKSSLSPLLIELPTAETFVEKVRPFVERDQLKDLSASLRAMEIEHLVQQMPIPNSNPLSFWNKIPPEKILLAMETIVMLQRGYYKAITKQKTAITPKLACTMHVLFAISHHLALWQDKIKNSSSSLKLSHFPIHFSGIAHDKDSYFAFFLPHEHERWEQIVNYFKNLHKNTEFFGKDTLFNFDRFNFNKPITFYSENPSRSDILSYLWELTRDPRFAKLLNGDLEVAYHSLTMKKVNTGTHEDHKRGLLLAVFAESLLLYQSVLTNSDFAHIPYLLQAASFSHLFSSFKLNFNHVPYFSTTYTPLKGKRSESVVALSYQLSYEFKNNQLAAYLRKERRDLLEKSTLQKVKNHNTVKLEGEVLANASRSETDPGLDEVALLCTSCEPSLFPFKLFSYYLKNLHLLESPQEQCFFELALFRSLSLYTQEVEAVDQLSNVQLVNCERIFSLTNCLKEKSFQMQVACFIQEGIDLYFRRQPKQKPLVVPATFFIRLISRFSLFSSAEPFMDSLSLLKQMLSYPSISIEESNYLALHVVLAYSCLQRKLTQDEIADALSLWVFYKSTPALENFINIQLEKELESFVFKISDSFIKNQNPEWGILLFSKVLAQFGKEFPKSNEIVVKWPYLEARNDNNNFETWKINFITGELSSSNGAYKKRKAPDYLFENEHFRHLFGSSNNLVFDETDDGYYLTHPVLGSFRIVKDSMNKNFFRVEKQIGKVWYQYSLNHCVTSFPSYLRYNKVHWVSLDPNQQETFICDRLNGELIAKIDSKGRIESADQKKKFPNFPIPKFIEGFESLEHLHWTSENNKIFLHFWRFQSQSLNPLCFEWVNNRLVFVSNRHFHLSTHQKTAFFEESEGVLTLINSKGNEEKFLVALKFFQEKNKTSTFSDLEEKIETCQYLEFDLKHGSLFPLTQEGLFYLAFLYLKQKRYQLAHYWIRQNDSMLFLSYLSHKILVEIVNHSLRNDTSAESCAISMHAWLVLKKLADRNKGEGKPFKTPPDHKEIFAHYCRYEHQIPESLLLNSEEQALTGLQNGKKEFTNYPVIQKFLPNFQHNQAYIKVSYDFVGNISTRAIKERIDELKGQGHTELDAYRKISLKYELNAPAVPFWSYRDELSFREAYTILKEGSDSEKRWVAFKLQLAKKYSTESWAILQLAYNHPSKAPKLPHSDSSEYNSDFANKAREIALNLQTSNFEKPTPVKTEGDKQKEPLRHLSAAIIPPKKAELAKNPLQLLPFSKETIDDNFTQDIFHSCFVKREKKTSNAALPFLIPESALEKEERQFFEILQAEFKEFNKDYEEGCKINKGKAFFDLKSPEKVQIACEKEIEKLDHQLADLESSILELANKQDSQNAQTRIAREAKICSLLTIKKLTALFLQKDADAFYKANPYLRNDQLIHSFAKTYNLSPDQNLIIDYLYNKMGLFMTLFVHRTHLQRAKTLCEKIILEVHSELTRDSLIQKLSDELTPHAKPIYEISQHPEFLVYEFLSGLTLRPIQVHLLSLLLETKDGKYINRVIQLIMSGGKTTVLAAVLLKMGAKKGRLSLFITPASQYASVSYNLRKTFRECFDIEVEEVDVTRQQLATSNETCLQVLTTLRNVSEAGDVLLMKSETLQTIGLEFIDMLYQITHEEDMESLAKLEIVNTLKDVLIFFKERGDAILDEVDLLLNVLYALNFTIGKKEKLAFGRIAAVKELFLLFSSEKVECSNGKFFNLEKILKLSSNNQNLVPLKTLETILADAVAFNLPKKVSSLMLKDRPDLHKSFERYLNKKMKNITFMELSYASAKEKNDYQFMELFRDWRSSENPAEKEAAHQIALIKHVMQIVLAITLKKKGKQNYGRVLSSTGDVASGEVVPYSALDNPSKYYFGYHWEAVVYHFQTALQCGVSKVQFLKIGKIYVDRANNRTQKEKMSFEETREAIQFYSTTGLKLYELDNNEKVDKALAKLNSKENLENLLQFESLTAHEYVGYYPLRETSTGQCLIDSLSSIRAMSGTPWNIDCYPKELAENFESMIGTEGQIAHEIISRTAEGKKGKNYTYIVDSKDVAVILKEVLETHAQKSKVRCWMDAGALFENNSNFGVALVIRDYLKLPVLFFTRDPSIQQENPDTLAVLKMGAGKPDIIGSTNLDEIRKTGINLEDYFIFLDQKHTTGTNLQMIPDVIAILSVNSNMLKRDFFQAVMRPREFFLNQDVEFVIPKYLLPILNKMSANKKIENEDLRLVHQIITMGVKNQVVAKSQHYERSIKNKIDMVFRKLLNDTFLIKEPLTKEFICCQFPNYESTNITTQYDNPSEQFGELEGEVKILDSLEVYRREKLSRFPKSHPRRKEIEIMTEQLINEANIPLLPKTVLEKPDSVETEVEVLTEVDVNVQQDVNLQLDEDIYAELKVYTPVHNIKLLPEKKWKDDEIQELINQLSIGKKSNLLDLSEMLGDKNLYVFDYSNVFSSGLLATQSWAKTTESDLTVFNKMQRPLDQIFIVKLEHGFRGVALSQNETTQFKNFLNKNLSAMQKGVWLIQSDGTLLQDAFSEFPLNNELIKKLLVECNVFNGNFEYLASHEKETYTWLHEWYDDYVGIKKQFLKLKAAGSSYKTKSFFDCKVLHQNQTI